MGDVETFETALASSMESIVLTSLGTRLASDWKISDLNPGKNAGYQLRIQVVALDSANDSARQYLIMRVDATVLRRIVQAAGANPTADEAAAVQDLRLYQQRFLLLNFEGDFSPAYDVVNGTAGIEVTEPITRLTDDLMGFTASLLVRLPYL